MATYLGFNPNDQNPYYFISYKTEDADRITPITQALSEQGISLWNDYGIPYDAKWEGIIAEKINHCRTVILFYTNTIFKNENSYVPVEYNMARFYNKDILTVFLEKIDQENIPYNLLSWTIELKQHHSISANSMSNSDIVNEILRAISNDTSKYSSITKEQNTNIQTNTSGKSKLSILSALPPKNECVLHRDDDVENVINLISAETPYILINGMGGIGKTSVANNVFYRIKDEYNYIAWIQYHGTLKQSILDAIKNDQFHKNENTTKRYDQILSFLRSAKGNKLLFIDNINDLAGLDYELQSLKDIENLYMILNLIQ